jgi:hypothetical protein
MSKKSNPERYSRYNRNLKAISKLHSTMVSNNDNDISMLLSAMLLFFSQPAIAWVQCETRQPSLYSQFLIWNGIVETHQDRALFKRHLRMSSASFHKLLSYIEPALAIATRENDMALRCFLSFDFTVLFAG